MNIFDIPEGSRDFIQSELEDFGSCSQHEEYDETDELGMCEECYTVPCSCKFENGKRVEEEAE